MTNGTSIKTTDYLDGFQYNEQVLEFFPTTEGYVKATPTGLVPPGTPLSAYAFNYVFNYTDHLGNVRVSYTKDPQTGNLKILDESHYYPFGLKHQEYSTFGFVSNPIQGVIIAPLTNNPYKYKYNGKEFQDELNLNMYDMDMRQYDPAIARWVVMDPVIHHSMSPYSAFDNNPVFWADPSGAAPEIGSVFEQSGMKVASLTVQGTGVSIGAGGAYTKKSSTDSNNSPGTTTNKNSGNEEWPEQDSDAIVLDEVVITNMDQLEGAMEDRIVNQAFPSWSNMTNASPPKWLNKANDGVGGLGTGLQKAGGTFRLTNGAYNGNKISLKHYESGWKGGSRAQIKTYSSVKYGKVIGRGSIAGTVILGSISIADGIQQDEGTFEKNASVATGGVVGGGLGAWGGAVLGAEIGAGFGALFGGVGAVPGAFIGGIVGGIAGGIIGTETGEAAVNAAY